MTVKLPWKKTSKRSTAQLFYSRIHCYVVVSVTQYVAFKSGCRSLLNVTLVDIKNFYHLVLDQNRPGC